MQLAVAIADSAKTGTSEEKVLFTIGSSPIEVECDNRLAAVDITVTEYIDICKITPNCCFFAPC